MTPEAREVRRRLRDDFAFYAPRALKVRSKLGAIIPLKLNTPQKRLNEAVEAQRASKGYVRVIILKARQEGISTLVGARMFWSTTQHKARKAIVVTHHADSTRALFDMTRRFYDDCPEILRPHSRYLSRRELQFDQLSSGYMVATAGGDGIARGETITDAHLSELAFWPKSSAESNFLGLMQAIPDVPGTSIYIESTANGVSGLFYDLWNGAVHGTNGFLPVFLPWFIDETYREEPAMGFTRTPEEEELCALFDLDNGQLQFRRKKVAQIGREGFQQEYPSTPDEAFLTTGRPVFNPDQVVELLRSAPEPILRLALEGDEWQPHPRGELQCYRELDEDETYYIGADVGAGVQRDWSVAQVMDSHKRQVAVFRAQVDPDYYATVLLQLCRYYNDAFIVVEHNNHGILTCTRLAKDFAYPNFYTETIYDKLTDEETVRLGFTTSRQSKSMIIDELRASLREHEIEISDRSTLEEMRSFIVTNSGKMEAETGKHDDCVMALALVNHINEGAFTPIKNEDEWYIEAI